MHGCVPVAAMLCTDSNTRSVKRKRQMYLFLEERLFFLALGKVQSTNLYPPLFHEEMLLPTSAVGF